MSNLKAAAQGALLALKAGSEVDPIFAGETEAALEAALADFEPVQEPLTRQQAGLRRGDILRCVESGVLCTVWTTSTSGKTLVKWGPNDFGSYTAEQIGELFWVEPVQEPVAWMYDCGNGGRMYAEELDDPTGWIALHIAPPQRPLLTDEEISDLFSEAVKGDRSVHWLCRAVERAVRGDTE